MDYPGGPGETGFRKTVSEARIQNPHKTLKKQTFQKSAKVEKIENHLEKSMFLIIFPESDFFKKVAHVHSESFAPVFKWSSLFRSRFMTKKRF